MVKLFQDFKEFLELLIEKKAEYLIVGAYALAFHGHPRNTGDIDIWINNTRQNAEKIYIVLKDFGFPLENITIEDFEKEDLVLQMGYQPVRIDLMTSVEALNFNECYKNKEKILYDGLELNFLDLEDFKKNKKAVGRNKDLADLDELE